MNGNVSFDSALKITAQQPDTQGSTELESQIQQLVAQKATQTGGLDYFNQLAANPNVQWDTVALSNEHWSYSQQGLTPAGVGLLFIAMVAYTGCMGVDTLGASATTAEGSASIRAMSPCLPQLQRRQLLQASPHSSLPVLPSMQNLPVCQSASLPVCEHRPMSLWPTSARP